MQTADYADDAEKAKDKVIDKVGAKEVGGASLKNSCAHCSALPYTLFRVAPDRPIASQG
jgi:hypothetical protein